MSGGRRSSGVHWPLRLQDHRSAAVPVKAIADEAVAPLAVRVDALEADVAGHEARIVTLETTMATLRAEATIALTGAQTAIPSNASLLRVINGATLTIQGIAPGAPGQQLTIVARGTAQIDVVEQSGAAPAANRIATGVASGFTVLPTGGGRLVLEYDGTSALWRVVQFEQGAWLQPPFNAADFTAAGGGSWTVASGNVFGNHYMRQGRSVTWNVFLVNTAVAGVVTELRIAFPPGWASAHSALTPLRYGDAGALAPQLGFIEVRTNYLAVGRNDGSAFPAGTQTYVQGVINFETI